MCGSYLTTMHCLKNKLTHKNKVNFFLHTYVVYFQSSEKISWISQHFGWSSCKSTIPDNTPSSVLLHYVKIWRFYLHFCRAIIFAFFYPALETGILVAKLFMFFQNSNLDQESIAKIHPWIIIHCCHFGSKSTKVSKLSVRRKWVCHIVAQPKGYSKHALEYS